MKFKGDIIITDPCYIMREKKERVNGPGIRSRDDWEECGYGSSMEVLGIHNYLTADTEYGDWSCTTLRDVPEAVKALEELNENYSKIFNVVNFEKDEVAFEKLQVEREKIKKKHDVVLGEFCADAGLVSVFLLSEVLAYNPEFDYHLNNKHACTLIKDFDGDVEITHRSYQAPDLDEEFHEIPGKFHEEREVSVVGKGNVNFYTTQTGL